MRLAPPLLAFALCAALASCTGQDNPTPAPLPSPTQTETKTTEPVDKDPSTPEEFLSLFVTTLNASISTGDTESFRGLFTKACSSCETITRNIEAVYDAGGSVESDGWELRDVQVLGPESGGDTVIGFRAHLSEQRVLNGPAAEEEVRAASTVDFVMRVRETRQTWRATDLEIVG